MIRGTSAALWLASTLAAFAVQTTTYQVDMSVQITLGNFHPGTDTIFVAGDFSSPNWQQTIADGATNFILAPSGGNPNIYVGTFNDVHAPADFENHKFIINPGGNFSALNWENVSGGGNRFFQVPAGATNLPVVFFSDVTNASSVVTIPVTYQINMSVQTALGNFDPANDFVFVAGDAVNNWSPTASQLTQSVSDTNIWTGTFNITSTVGGTVNHKFIMNRLGERWCGTQWRAEPPVCVSQHRHQPAGRFLQQPDECQQPGRCPDHVSGRPDCGKCPGQFHAGIGQRICCRRRHQQLGRRIISADPKPERPKRLHRNVQRHQHRRRDGELQV
jgi:hypothetical protein